MSLLSFKYQNEAIIVFKFMQFELFWTNRPVLADQEQLLFSKLFFQANINVWEYT